MCTCILISNYETQLAYLLYSNFYNLLRGLLPNCVTSLCFKTFPDVFLGSDLIKNKIFGALYPAKPFWRHHSFIVSNGTEPPPFVTIAQATTSPYRSSLRGKIAHSTISGCCGKEMKLKSYISSK